MKQILKALNEVSKSVGSIEKKMTVGTGRSSYKGVSWSEVASKVQPELNKNGLIFIPVDIEEETTISEWNEKTNYGEKRKQSVMTRVKVYYEIIHESGEKLRVCGIGHGQDPMDKAAGKATTYALKNAIMYSLTLAGELDDTDQTHSNEIETPKKNKIKDIEKVIKAIEEGKKTKQFFYDNYVLTDQQKKLIENV